VAAEAFPHPDGPRESPGRIFLRFLRFGLLAWGGPVAQIAMIRQELVEEERWIPPARFNRVLSVYQALPGPEAHELCVYFGMLAGGRLGGFLAGLGFMLPGFLLMLGLSWFYVRYGVQSPLFAAVFAGFQPAVAALIVRAVHRIGQHALTNRWLWGVAIAGGIAALAGVNFLVILLGAGIFYLLVRRGQVLPAFALVGLAILGVWMFSTMAPQVLLGGAPVPARQPGMDSPSVLELFINGLRTGLLTFGGAYTAIPFLQHYAVVVGGFMTNEQFLDGLALSGILPAPLIIFGTFVGYLGGGAAGALALTVGIFLPAFSMTLLGHDLLERLVETPALHNFLDGITAGVVGLIAATALGLARVALTGPLAGPLSWLLFAAALLVLYRWKARAAVPVVVLGAGLLGLLFFR
jgi:chromate transporter